MPDFEAFRAGKLTYQDLQNSTDYHELSALAGGVFNQVEAIVADLTDKAVDFVPKDEHLQDPGEQGWTLGHVIAHLTAGLEEFSAMGAMLARGVPIEGRLRYETPWEEVHTANQVHQRLTESRRITHAFFGGWPDAPHFDVTRLIVPSFGPLNATGVALLGIMHGTGHYDQLREIMRQAKEL